jgi:prephenate dehydrogenase
MQPKLKTAIIGVGVMGKKYAEMISSGQVEHCLTKDST